MHDVAVGGHGVQCAQQGVDDRFEMFGSYGGQPAHPHALVSVHGRSKVSAAIDGDFVPKASQLMTNLLVIGFDAAVLGNQTASSDRKSTRLNSSHLGISYAVFCLKKKKYSRRFFIFTY